jgi:hypothetical protein
MTLFIYCYAECCYAECHYAESRGAQTEVQAREWFDSGPKMIKTLFVIIFLSISVSGHTRTLTLRVMSRVFYHCATTGLYYKNIADS